MASKTKEELESELKALRSEIKAKEALELEKRRAKAKRQRESSKVVSARISKEKHDLYMRICDKQEKRSTTLIRDYVLNYIEENKKVLL